ncbi:MAG: AMP-binding protein, partial [Cyanobacteria bacterium J06573_2]
PISNTQPLLHQLFFDRVALNPDKQAIVTSNQSFTYQELSNYSKTLALELQQLGVQQNQLIAVVMSKGWEQIVAVLGILAAGAAYVPIDPELPEERRFQILQQAQIKYVVTQPWLNNSLEWENNITRILIKSPPSSPSAPSASSAPSPHSLTDTIYAQPAIFVIEYALAQLWISWGIRPQALIGHSIGEYVAGAIANVFSLEDALEIVAMRGQLMQKCPPGAMLAVSLTESELKQYLNNDLT